MFGALLLLAAQATTAPPLSTRAAVERALPALQRSARRFVAERSCVSCHHNILPILTFRLAASRGFAIDVAALRDIERKTFRELVSARAFDDAVQGASVSDPTPNESWLLIAAHTAGLDQNLTTAVMARRIASWQREGHWTTSDFRPPHSSSVFTATATAAAAIRAYFPDEMHDARDRALADARQWLTNTAPRSTEDAAFRVLGLVWSNAPTSDIENAAVDLRKLQRSGGGWNQLPDYPSDAYSTGEALYALHEAGLSTADVAWRRGIAFLRTTQAADGTWHVRTRMLSPAEVSPPYFTTGFPYRKDEYISYAASSWATLALLTALPPAARTPVLARPAAESAPDSSNGVLRVALFGTAEQLSRLQDVGFDANWRTPGGTSLLMAAAPDAAKLTVLLKRGADARYRADSTCDAITAATSYGGSAPALRVLLDAGADVEPPAGVKAKHSPLLFASMSGDVDAVALLLSRGAKPNPPPNPSGDSPISEAITFGRAGVVSALINAGAKVDLVERTGVNLLHWAAITNRASVIPVLRKAGVDVDAIDANGFTPLMYAATIDFGDTSTIEALLAAGANRLIRNAQGRTPLAQARYYRHTQLARVLAQ